MRFKLFLVLSVFLFCEIASAQATVVKGNVATKGHKSYGFTTRHTGQISLTLVYDNKQSDIDLIAGTVNDTGDTVIVGVGSSSQNFFERVEFGLDEGVVVVFLV